MTQVVIYSRFSPRRNAEESESCETQEQLCREHASRQGWPVRAAHRDEEVSVTWADYGLESKTVGSEGRREVR